MIRQFDRGLVIFHLWVYWTGTGSVGTLQSQKFLSPVSFPKVIQNIQSISTFILTQKKQQCLVPKAVVRRGKGSVMLKCCLIVWHVFFNFIARLNKVALAHSKWSRRNMQWCHIKGNMILSLNRRSRCTFSEKSVLWGSTRLYTRMMTKIVGRSECELRIKRSESYRNGCPHITQSDFET